MKKITTLLCMMACMATFTTSVMADEPITPPGQLPQEEWTMTFANYDALVTAFPSAYPTRNVTLVRDDNTLYIRGIFEEYPDAWITGSVNGSTLSIKTCQLIAVENEDNMYFHCGNCEENYSEGNTYRNKEVTFSPSTLSLTVSDDGDMIESGDISSFWYSSKKYGKVRYWENSNLEYTDDEYNKQAWVTTGTGFPAMDYLIKISFSRGTKGGIDGILCDSPYETAPMYNLQGQVVNPATAVPGIYIRNGRKIVITRR